MKKRYCHCFDMEPHKEHKWRVRWWNRPWICRGVYPHKHRHWMQLTRILITPAGWPVARENVYWQCVSCWYIHSQNRQELKEEMLKQKVDQTWPS